MWGEGGLTIPQAKKVNTAVKHAHLIVSLPAIQSAEEKWLSSHCNHPLPQRPYQLSKLSCALARAGCFLCPGAAFALTEVTQKKTELMKKREKIKKNKVVHPASVCAAAADPETNF